MIGRRKERRRYVSSEPEEAGGGGAGSGAADWLSLSSACCPFKGAKRPLPGAVGLRSPEVRGLPRSRSGAGATAGRPGAARGDVGLWGGWHGRPGAASGEASGGRAGHGREGVSAGSVFQEGRGLGELFLNRADEWRRWMTSNSKVKAAVAGVKVGFGAQLMEGSEVWKQG